MRQRRSKRAEIQLVREANSPYAAHRAEEAETPLDFTASPQVVRVVVEGERLTFGYLFNPTFATEISRVVPLPHQRLAVYDALLPQYRLRFLLADDAGAGKTIMTGLYLREMLSRRLITRALIVCPAGLVGNWEHELRQLFNLHASIIEGADARGAENPFMGEQSNLVIVSVDTLCGERMFARLQESGVVPYDIAVFDAECERDSRPGGTSIGHHAPLHGQWSEADISCTHRDSGRAGSLKRQDRGTE